jgi:hypothetical protein
MAKHLVNLGPISKSIPLQPISGREREGTIGLQLVKLVRTHKWHKTFGKLGTRSNGSKAQWLNGTMA